MKTTQYSNLLKEKSSDVYYKAAYQMVSHAKHFYVAAKTPTLLIPQEQQTHWRKKYLRKAEEKIQQGLEVHYLFSWPETKKAMLSLGKTRLAKALKKWEEYAKLANFKPGLIANSNFDSFITDGNYAIFAVKDAETGKSIGIRIETAKQALHYFMELEREANPDLNKAIVELKEKG